MLVDVGFYLLFGIVLLCAWSACSFLVGGVLRDSGWVRSGERGVYLAFGAVVACSAILIHATYAEDYSVSYVAQVSDRALSNTFKFTSWWAGMDGSMLLWMLCLSAYSAAAVWALRKRHRALAPWVGLTLSVTMLFFGAMIAFETNPLERLEFTPADGQGMNPALQNYWMAIHPPTLYVGYTGLVVPFAFAIAALVTGRLDIEWIRAVRRWMLVPWAALGVGMVFGGLWAYEELGWGGYWAWDPVENASLMPWLMATAYLHSAMVQERRGMFRTWNVVLVVSAFLLSIFGTFITRSGIVESVHSFARSNIGWWFLGFVVISAAVSIALTYFRLDELKAVNRIDSLVSREFSFMLNNLVFVSLTLVTLFLTMYPTISEIATGLLTRVGLAEGVERWTVGASAYNEINGSLGLLLLVLTGIGPALAWHKSTGRHLARQLVGPLGLGLLVAAGVVVAGHGHWMAVIAWGGAAFVAACIALEFHRGARVLAHSRGTGYLTGLSAAIERNKRRYGGYVVHLGIVMLFIGMAGMALKEEAEALLSPGETVSVHGFDVHYAGPVFERKPGTDVYSVSLLVSRGGREVTELRPEFKIHDKFPEPEKDVAIHSSFGGDLYAILAQPVTEQRPQAKLQVLWNPLMFWIWAACPTVLLGTLICAWPEGERRRSAAARRPGERAA